MSEAVTYKRSEDFPGYVVGSNGTVYSLLRGKFIVPAIDKKEYMRISLMNKNSSRGRSCIKLHRLVAKTFLGESNLQVNHIDKNKTNNSLCNLEYVTQSENLFHRFSGEKRFVNKYRGKWRSAVILGRGVRLRPFKMFDSKEEAYSHAREVYYKHTGVYPW